MRASRVLCKEFRFRTNCFTKGNGLFGALGRGNFQDSTLFAPINVPDDDIAPFKCISAGSGHSAAVTARGDLVLFGRPYDFQSLLRLNRIRRVIKPLSQAIASFAYKSDQQTGIFPSPTTYIKDGNIVDVSCSAGFTLALDNDGRVFALGSNRWGQCAIPTATTLLSMKPSQVPLECKITAIDTGLQHAIALSEDGRVYTWGKGNRGQLGDGDHEDAVFVPYRVGALKNVISIGAGFGHSVAITQDGSIYVWGRGMSDIRTDKKVVTFNDQRTPRKLSLPNGRKALSVTCSIFTSVVLADDNTLWAFGVGEHDRNFISNPVPVLRPIPDSVQPPAAPASMTFSAVLKSILPFGSRTSSEPALEIDYSFYDVPAVLGKGLIRKGYQRVSVLYDPGTSPYAENSDSLRGDYYDIVLHNGEAYYLRLELDPPKVADSGADHRIIDYCAGANHAILLTDSVL